MRKTSIILGFIAFTYYLLLCSTIHTWMFVSEDSNGWLSTASIWMAPQPLGSPIYVLLGRLLSIFPGELVPKMTVFLSCLPSAVTVSFVYLIVYKLTKNNKAAIASSLILIGSAVFLTQSTVIEEYALAVMFMTIAYWFQVSQKRKLTWVTLGLSCAVHAFVIPIAAFWFFADSYVNKCWKANFKALPLYFLFGAFPYTFVLFLMAADTPRLNAGGLNWVSARDYFFGVSSIVPGSLSIFDFHRALLDFVIVVATSLGLAMVAVVAGFKDVVKKHTVLLSIIVYNLWFYFTCRYGTAWVFIIFIMPTLAIIAGIGLSKMKRAHYALITTCAVCLIAINSVFLNADVLAKRNPIPQMFFYEVLSMKDGSVVVGTPRYTGVSIYAMSQGKDIVPITVGYTDFEDVFDDYILWLEEKHNLTGDGTFGLVEDALNDGRDVYYVGVDRDPYTRDLAKCFILDGDGSTQRIIGLTGIDLPEVTIKNGSE